VSTVVHFENTNTSFAVMSRYRRAVTPHASYFFTVASYRRRPILCDAVLRDALRAAIEMVRGSRPFVIDAWVLMPDHFHCIWTLPEGDADFSARWMMIKRAVSLACRDVYHRQDWMNSSKVKHRESTIWQRRYWEHQIRDEEDFNRHVDYIHFNPVKHGHVPCVADWPHSTFHRYVREGVYARDWVGGGEGEGLEYD
jgi:putative transposase